MKKILSVFLAILVVLNFSVTNATAETKLAKIGENKYDTIQQAIDAASSGETVTVLGDSTGNLTVDTDDSITIDLNGCTITGKVSVYGNLTIKDSVGTGKVYKEETGAYYVQAVILMGDNATFTLESGTLETFGNNAGSHACTVQNSATIGTINIKGGNVISNALTTDYDWAIVDQWGDGVTTYTTSLNITGGAFTGLIILQNNDTGDLLTYTGHDESLINRVLNASGKTKIVLDDDINLTNNITVSSGKNVTLDLNGHILNGAGTGSVITNNGILDIIDSNTGSKTHKFKVSSSGLWVLDTSIDAETYTLDSNGLKKSGVKTLEVPNENSIILVSGGCIVGGVNNTENGGGGVYNGSSGTLTLSSGNIIGNTGKYGGGIRNNGGTLNIKSGAVSGNTATSSGGGIWQSSSTALNIFGGVVLSNGNGVLGSKSNLYLVQGKLLTIDSTFNGTIGITSSGTPTHNSPIKISNVVDKNYGSNILSDDNGYDATYNSANNYMELAIHNWAYTLSSDNKTITASCINSCTYSGTDTSLTISSPSSLEYDGGSHNASFSSAVSFLGGSLPTITYMYKDSEDGTYVATADTKNAGYYKASFTCGDKTGYVEYVVSKKQLTVTGTDAYNRAYDGTTNINTALGTVTGVIAGDDATVEVDSATVPDKSAGAKKEVTIIYKVTGTSANNYIKPVNDTSYVNISPVQLSVSGTTVDGKVYDGTNNAVAHLGTVSGIVTNDDCKVEIDSATFSDKNVGNGKDVTIVYKVTGTDSGNYTKPIDDSSVADIEKKTLNIVPDSKTSYIGSDLLKLTYSSDLCDGDSLTGALTTTADKDKVGTYDITLGSLLVNDGNNGNNYTLNFTKGTYTVTDKEVQDMAFLGLVQGKVKKVYGDEPFIATLTGAKTSLSYTSSDESVATVDSLSGEVTILKAGTAIIKASAIENYMYEAEEASYILVVDKADSVIDTTNVIKTYTYTGSEQVISGGATLNHSETNLVYEDNKFTNVGNGKYVVKISSKETENYKEASTTVEVTVNKASYDMSNAKWNYEKAFTYDGSEKIVEVIGLPKGVTVKEYSNNSKTNSGNYTSHVTFSYDEANYNEPTIDDLNWSINKITKLVYGDNLVIVEDSEGFPDDVSLEVDITKEEEITGKDLTVDYSNLPEDIELQDNEKIGIIYTIRLMKTVDGVSSEIKPSDIGKFKVRIYIPDTIDILSITRVLHVNINGDIEEIVFDNSKVDDRYYEVTVDSSSEFAFIYEDDEVVANDDISNNDGNGVEEVTEETEESVIDDASNINIYLIIIASVLVVSILYLCFIKRKRK